MHSMWRSRLALPQYKAGGFRCRTLRIDWHPNRLLFGLIIADNPCQAIVNRHQQCKGVRLLRYLSMLYTHRLIRTASVSGLAAFTSRSVECQP